jgi:hypothetical protein
MISKATQPRCYVSVDPAQQTNAVVAIWDVTIKGALKLVRPMVDKLNLADCLAMCYNGDLIK